MELSQDFWMTKMWTNKEKYFSNKMAHLLTNIITLEKYYYKDFFEIVGKKLTVLSGGHHDHQT